MTPQAAGGQAERGQVEGGQADQGQLFRQAVLLPSALLFFAMLNLTLIVAGLRELIIDELGGSPYDASLFFSVEMLAYVIFAPLWGILSDRLGRRMPFVVTGFLLSAVVYAACAMAQSIPMLLALRFFQGAVSVMGWSTLMVIVLDQPDDKKRGRYMGIMGAALTFGVSLGAPLGGFVSKSFGVRAPLWASAGIFCLLAVAALMLRDARQVRSQVGIGEILSTLRGRPRLLLPYLFHFVDRYTVGFFVIVFPLYLASEGVSDPGRRGLYLAAFMIPFSALQYFTGRLSEILGPYRPLLVGSLIYGVVLCSVGYSSLFALWWVMAILGVLASVMFPPSIILTAQLSDARARGSAMGGFNLAGSLGFAVGPLVGTWANDVGGYGFAFIVSGVLEILVVLLALGLLAYWRNSSLEP